MSTPESVVRVGVVGAGIGMVHIKAQLGLQLEDPRFKLAAVCDANKEVWPKVGKAFTDLGLDDPTEPRDHAVIFDAYYEFLDEADVNAIILAVPNDLHASFACAAIEAGKHVLIEKPLAHTLEDAREIAKAAKAHPELVVSMMMNNCLRRDAAIFFERLHLVGTIEEVSAWWERSNGIPFRGQWFTQKARAGGGAVIDLGPHMLGLILNCFKWYTPLTLRGYTWQQKKGGNGPYGGGTKTPNAPIDVETRAHANMEFPGNVRAVCRVAWASHRPDECFGLRVFGSEATLEWTRHWPVNDGDDDKAEDAMWLYSNHGGGTLSKLMNDENPCDKDPLMGRDTNSRNFALRCAGETVPLITISQAFDVSRIIQAWYHSADDGSTVHLADV